MDRLSLSNQASRRVPAIICLALFLVLQVFTSSETLHKLIHPDADSADHQCAITMFAHGQVNSVETVVTVSVLVAAIFFFLPALQSAVFSSFDYCLSSSRAPPLA